MAAKSALLFIVVLIFGTVDQSTSNSQLENVQFPFDLPKGIGPWMRPSVGEVWPKPQLQKSTDNIMILRPNHFKFQVILLLALLFFQLLELKWY